MTWLAALGWLAAIALAVATLRSRRRLERVARAEHEIRGPVAALALGFEQVRRGRSGADLAETLEAQLERSRAGLADLAAALGHGRPAPPRPASSLEWLARRTVAGWTPVADERWPAHAPRLAGRTGDGGGGSGQVRQGARQPALERHRARGGGGRGPREARRRRGQDRGDGQRRQRSRAGPSPARPLRGPETSRSRFLPVGNGAAGSESRSSAAEEAGGSLRVVPGPAGTTAVLELPLAER